MEISRGRSPVHAKTRINTLRSLASISSGAGALRVGYAVAPALIETEMITGNPLAKPDRIPVGRFGTTEEVAEVAVMLARNGYMTGQTINVNGGLYLS